MITIKKLLKLKDTTRYRKYISLLREVEEDLKTSKSINTPYIKSVFSLIKSDFPDDLGLKALLDKPVELRNINNIRHRIMGILSIEPSEWDLYTPKDSSRREKIYPINIYMDDLRSPFNIGSIFRSAECFCVNNIFISENTTPPNHKRSLRTSMGCIEKVNWCKKKLKELEGPLFALELGGTPIDEFEFPEKGTVIIGNEELGVSPEALKLCDSSLGRVTIPLYGSKSSLNVSNATSILLQRWSEFLVKK